MSIQAYSLTNIIQYQPVELERNEPYQSYGARPTLRGDYALLMRFNILRVEPFS